jgi:hypothetical protein
MPISHWIIILIYHDAYILYQFLYLVTIDQLSIIRRSKETAGDSAVYMTWLEVDMVAEFRTSLRMRSSDGLVDT